MCVAAHETPTATRVGHRTHGTPRCTLAVYTLHAFSISSSHLYSTDEPVMFTPPFPLIKILYIIKGAGYIYRCKFGREANKC